MSYTRLIYHVIFSTKHREPWITPGLEERLYADLRRCIVALGGNPLEINGVEDHVHLLFGMKPSVDLSFLVGQTKARTSRWLSRKGGPAPGFAWQEGYGAFTANPHDLDALREYIWNQKGHHRAITTRPGYEWDPEPD